MTFSQVENKIDVSEYRRAAFQRRVVRLQINERLHLSPLMIQEKTVKCVSLLRRWHDTMSATERNLILIYDLHLMLSWQLA